MGEGPRTGTWSQTHIWGHSILEGFSKEVLLRRVLRRRLVRALVGTVVLKRVLRKGGGDHSRHLEGAEKAETRPFAEQVPPSPCSLGVVWQYLLCETSEARVFCQLQWLSPIFSWSLSQLQSLQSLSDDFIQFQYPPVFQLLHPYSNPILSFFFELIRIRPYITVTLQ